MTQEQQKNTNSSSGIQESGVGPEVKRHLSDGAAYLLSWLSDKDEPVHVTKVSDEYDEYLAELLDLRLVVMSTVHQGKLEVTPAGYDAVDKRIAIKYPFGRDATITDYASTLFTMSANAKNNFIDKLTRVGLSFFGEIHKGRLDAFFSMLVDINIFRRVSAQVNRKLHAVLNKCLHYYVSKEPARMAADTLEEQVIFWDTTVNEKICSQLEKLGEVNLKEGITLPNYLTITGLQTDDEGGVQLVYRDPYSEKGSEQLTTMSLDDVDPLTKVRLLRQMGP